MNKVIKNIFLIAMATCLSYLNGMVPALKNFPFKSASVLPYTEFESGKKYFVLAREAFGNAKGTWDAFGGSRDQGEVHPVQTAAREFSEESINLFKPKVGIEKYIDAASGNTRHIIANRSAVVYITYIPRDEIRKISYGFQNARKKVTQFKYKEKDAIAYVLWDDLAYTIAKAPRDKRGQLILPVKVNATVFNPSVSSNPAKSKVQKKIELRPFFVSVLQPFFQQKPFRQGKHKAIKFY